MGKKFNKKHLWWIIPVSLIVIGLVIFLISTNQGKEDITRECNKGEIKNRGCSGSFDITFEECEERVGGFFWAERFERCEGFTECKSGVCVEIVTSSGFRNGQDCSDSTDLFHTRYSSSSPCRGDSNKACGVQCDGGFGVGCSFEGSKGTLFVDYRDFC